MSLTGNRLKYTQAGFVKIDLALRETVSSHQNSEGRTVRRFIATLTVTDTGKGISHEYLKIKNSTLRFRKESTLATGSGLGLSMVNDLIKLLGGSIELQSQVGEGTRFEVNLPLKRAKSGTASSHVNRSLSAVMAKEIQAAPDSLRDRSFQLRISKAQSHRQVKESLRRHLIQWVFEAGDS
jgi:hypothetical protein